MLFRSELDEVERICNEKIMADLPVTTRVCGIDEARASGAMALFSEKYGDTVRVVDVEGFSRELCGGTHVRHTSEIGLLKITSEGSAAANVRRIEAVTSFDALAHLNAEEAQLRSVAVALKVSAADAAHRAADLTAQVKAFEDAEKKAKAAEAASKVEGALSDVLDAGYPLVVARIDGLDAEGQIGRAHL